MELRCRERSSLRCDTELSLVARYASNANIIHVNIILIQARVTAWAPVCVALCPPPQEPPIGCKRVLARAFGIPKRDSDNRAIC